MAYNLSVTKHAVELQDHLIHYLVYQLKNEQAAHHLLNELCIGI